MNLGVVFTDSRGGGGLEVPTDAGGAMIVKEVAQMKLKSRRREDGLDTTTKLLN
jgi:hypothetical protein